MNEFILQLLVLFGITLGQNVDPLYCFSNDANNIPYMEYSVVAVTNNEYVVLPVIIKYDRQFNILTTEYTSHSESHIFDIVPVTCDNTTFDYTARITTRYQRDKPIVDKMVYIPLDDGKLDVLVYSEGIIYRYIFIPKEITIENQKEL